MKTVAALYVEADGPYSSLDGVEVWDEARDARTYAGPHPVVAHPPCNSWSSLANINWKRWGTPRREDGGKFTAAHKAVRLYGGVVEHPAFSMAWKAHGLMRPRTCGGWTVADWDGGWTCHVEQGHYGHDARKGTWLYAVGVDLPSLRWGLSGKGTLGGPDKKVAVSIPVRDERRINTPLPFRDLLLLMARSVR